MATVKQAIGEVDVVAFVQAVDKDEGVGKWAAGTIGAVVGDHGDVKMVEIANDRGEALDFVMVPVEQLKLVTKHSQ
jgi:hypothetical protein